MALLPATTDTIKADAERVIARARERHRAGESPFDVVRGISQGMDEILGRLFSREFREGAEGVALVAVGGYGRQELCPFSDIDLLFLHHEHPPPEPVQRLVRLLWDSGFQLGHSVRTPAECYRFMCDDPITAATLLESRHLAGSRRLYGRFRVVALDAYARRRGAVFMRAKLDALRRSIRDPGRTIYVVEPHLKDGLACLRDIQRVLWIEGMRRWLLRGGDWRPVTLLCRGDREALREAYAFYLRVRCELHFTNGLRQDLLDRESLPAIVAHLGYRGAPREAVEAFMADYYRHARGVDRFLRHFVETETEGGRRLGRWRRRLWGRRLKPHLWLHEGTLYLEGEPDAADLAEEILDCFVTAHREDAALSESLLEWVRRRLEDEALDFMHSSPVRSAFLSILRGGRNSGRILKAMHGCGLLERIVPEIGRISGLVYLDGHHHFTVDEHTLRTHEELDRLEGDGAVVEAALREVLAEVKDRLPLRLALLLHDIGKAMPGDHRVNGSEAALRVCERLGMSEGTSATVEFLIYRHLDMFKVSAARDFTEDSVVEGLARMAGSEERLRLLYLFTYLDIVAVGPGMWTAWKGAQLAEVYQRTRTRLRTGTFPEFNLEADLAAAGIGEDRRRKILEHCELVGSRAYERETLPERMAFHLELVERHLETGRTQVGQQALFGYHEVTFCCRDRKHLFADLTGLLYSEGLNVLGARIFSRRDGVVIDLFQVEIADTLTVGVPRRVERIENKLRRIESRRVTVEDLIRQWGRTYRPRLPPKPLFGPAVTFDNGASEVCTLIEVNAADRPGLLYDLASAMSRLGLDLRTAKIATVGDRAHDVFYVVEADGHKVRNPARLKQIEQALLAEAQRPVSSLLQAGARLP